MRLSEEVPSNVQNFTSRQANDFHWAFKLIKRWLVIWLLGQRRLCKPNIQKDHQRVLWISICAPSLGDVLMDVSSRALLVERSIDLLTSEDASSLLKYDEHFGLVTSDLSEVLRKQHSHPYDLIITDSFSTRSIRAKHKIAPNVPFVSLFEFVNGFEVHRVRYSFRRMEYLLARPVQDVQPVPLNIPCDLTIPCIPSQFITVAVGARHDFRGYLKWLEVIEQLMPLMPDDLMIVLVGSSNGTDLAKEVISNYPSVISLVDQLTLPQTTAVISKSLLFVGADGGLWHVAWNVGVPSVVLFANCDLFEGGRRVTREIDAFRAISLYAPVEVSDIAVEEVIKAIQEKLGEVLVQQEAEACTSP